MSQSPSVAVDAATIPANRARELRDAWEDFVDERSADARAGEIADAPGGADFGQDDFEEIMSTHYGRMVVLDDRVLMFANPEDAAEYVGFALQPVTEA
jgi:hypothetical protein